MNNNQNWWIEALQQALQIALKQAKIHRTFHSKLVHREKAKQTTTTRNRQHQIKTIVPLYKAKLWCDTQKPLRKIMIPIEKIRRTNSRI